MRPVRLEPRKCTKGRVTALGFDRWPDIIVYSQIVVLQFAFGKLRDAKLRSLAIEEIPFPTLKYLGFVLLVLIYRKISALETIYLDGSTTITFY